MRKRKGLKSNTIFIHTRKKKQKKVEKKKSSRITWEKDEKKMEL